MLGLLKKLMGGGEKVNIAEKLAQGAVIVDVRTPGEYAGGHIKGSLNIPLADLKAGMSKLKKDKPVIMCCASGMRSGSACTMLRANGFTDVHNAGGWHNLKQYEQ